MAFSDQLAELMRQATTNRSQRAIAKKANVSQTTIGNMVLGRIPSRQICENVAEAADVDIHSLLVAAGYEQPSTVAETMKQTFAGRLPDEVLQNLIDYGKTIDEQLEREGLRRSEEEE